MELFQKALLYNDTKKLYFALLGIYENPKQPQGVQHDMADQLLKTMTRKFNTSAKVTFFAANWLVDQSVTLFVVNLAAIKWVSVVVACCPRISLSHYKVYWFNNSQWSFLRCFPIGNVGTGSC